MEEKEDGLLRIMTLFDTAPLHTFFLFILLSLLFSQAPCVTVITPLTFPHLLKPALHYIQLIIPTACIPRFFLFLKMKNVWCMFTGYLLIFNIYMHLWDCNVLLLLSE